MTAPRSATEALRALRDENEELREQVRQLREALAPTAMLPRQWRLSPTQERLLRALRAVGKDTLHRERAFHALYASWDDMPEMASLDALVSKLRRRLREAGAPIEIKAVWGRGWRLTPEGCAAYDAAVADDQAQWAMSLPLEAIPSAPVLCGPNQSDRIDLRPCLDAMHHPARTQPRTQLSHRASERQQREGQSEDGQRVPDRIGIPRTGTGDQPADADEAGSYEQRGRQVGHRSLRGKQCVGDLIVRGGWHG